MLTQIVQFIKPVSDVVGIIGTLCTALAALCAVLPQTRPAAKYLLTAGADLVRLATLISRAWDTIRTRQAIKRAALGGIVFAVVAIVAGCTSVKTGTTSAHSADNRDWPLCLTLDFTTAIPAVSNWSVMVCATTEHKLEEAKQSEIASAKAQHPDARLVRAARVPQTLAVRK